ncbi:MAG: Thioredoxin domain [Clostridia bacterium]|jgi:thiol-disulfide isomerase/thioredoxin|uniref:thioredoxin family protein n=1 Tax=Petroclostridium xylanilyticum TaxID=1792311 RepID=UPI000B982A6C|nr:thioredoxin family protein [Petroclostridium xylanilyticum]MBZ4646445.1 Thioredoxin domain [Clostridia bacterium]
MVHQKVNVKVVSLKEPCTACIIIDGLIKEILAKIQKEYNNVEVEIIELEHPKQAHLVKGLEVEKFPAILINDEQVTAGSLPSKQQLISMIQTGGA